MDIILNSVVLIFLCLTIAYCWKLNNRIEQLRNGKEELVDIVKSLDNSLNKANSAIVDIKGMSNETLPQMSSAIKQSEEIIQDLGFLVERAKTISEKLGAEIEMADKVTKSSTRKTVRKTSTTRKAKASSDVEKEKKTKKEDK